MSDYYNAPLFAAVISWIAAQIVKTIFYIIKFRSFNPERILGAGGMPSSHSATVCSLAIVISRMDGVNSVSFALAMVLAMVVMYDASGVRRAAGLHAREINRLKHIISELDENGADYNETCSDAGENGFDNQEDEKIKELKEFLGHTPTEVLCGAILGILVGMVIVV